MSDTYFDTTPSEIQTPEERSGMSPPDDTTMRRTNPKRYDKRHDMYDNNNDVGHDSGIENRYDDPIKLLGWDFNLSDTAEDLNDLLLYAKPWDLWIGKASRCLYVIGPNFKERPTIYDEDAIRYDEDLGAKYHVSNIRCIGSGDSRYRPLYQEGFIYKNEFPMRYVKNVADLIEDKLSWDVKIGFEIGDKVRFLSKRVYPSYLDAAIRDMPERIGYITCNIGSCEGFQSYAVGRRELTDIKDSFVFAEEDLEIVDDSINTLASDEEMEIDGKTYVKLPDPSGASGSMGAAFELKKRDGRLWCPKDRIKEFRELMDSIEDDLKKSSLVDSIDWHVDSLVRRGRNDDGQLNNFLLKRFALVSWDVPVEHLNIKVYNIKELLEKSRPGQVWLQLDSRLDDSRVYLIIKDGFTVKKGTIYNGFWGNTPHMESAKGGIQFLNDTHFPFKLILGDLVDINKESWDVDVNPHEDDIVRIVGNGVSVPYAGESVGRVLRVLKTIHEKEGLRESLSKISPSEKVMALINNVIDKGEDIFVVEDLGFFPRSSVELMESKKSFDIKDNRINFTAIPQDIRHKFRQQHMDLFNKYPELLNGMGNVEFIFTTRPYGVDPNIPGYIHPEELEVDLYGTPELLKKNPEAVISMLDVILQYIIKLQGLNKIAAVDRDLENVFDESETKYVKQHEDRLERMGPKINVVWSGEEAQKFRFNELLKLGDFNDKILVDIGCGFGSFLDFIEEHGQVPKAYVGVDLSEKMLGVAKELHPMEFFECRNIRINPFDSDVFDYGIASGIFANEFENWDEHVVSVLKSLLNSCKLGIGVNFLHEHEKYIGGGLHYDSPERVMIMLEKGLDAKIELLDHPEKNDFTLLIRK